MQGILGKKLGMTRLFLEEGKAVAVTVIEAGPCVVVQKKGEKNQETVYQLGFVPAKPKTVNKPIQGHYKKKGITPLTHLKEFPSLEDKPYQVGDEVRVDIFQIGDKVKVQGTSKGKGFAGVVKRWNFSGGKDTHGCTSHRVPGSIGSSAYPSRVVKGKKLPGHMGNRRVSVRHLSIVDIRPDQNLLIVKGAVPGSRNNLLAIYK
ncbi:MAG: 50S ribosomal protein L3 [Deltaproteobacteria bacterium RBG_13_43_22]|nr:MAG: 50S ribosomal protein L3 [Deltaproteobacteria bacterium RBG_13_43_22]